MPRETRTLGEVRKDFERAGTILREYMQEYQWNSSFDEDFEVSEADFVESIMRFAQEFVTASKALHDKLSD